MTALSADADVPVLPAELHRAISKFALWEYFVSTREDAAAANALTMAQNFLSEKLSHL